MIDVVKLAQDLIKCPSVTPQNEGALEILEQALTPLGFNCHLLTFEEPGTDSVQNLYARLGTESPHLSFAGHVDVVPSGDTDLWTYPPFAAHIQDGVLFGRGASDMKGSIAAFVTALSRYLKDNTLKGSLSFMITCDEEKLAINGTPKILKWLEERDETIDACLVGEPSSENKVGDTIKIGRRGSLSGKLTISGIQGHVAYFERANNPIPHLLRILQHLMATKWDEGNGYFPPSHLEVTTIDVGNQAGNVIPARASASFNIRFNDIHDGENLSKKIKTLIQDAAQDIPYNLSFHLSASPFLIPEGTFSNCVSGAVEKITGQKPILATTGGTSDARFIHHYCPVLELGGLNQTAHQVDENVTLEDLETLTGIYEQVLKTFFTSS